MNEHIHCPRHPATLVHQIRSGDELVGFYKCPAPGCTVAVPKAGCLWCGSELEMIDMSYRTADGSHGVLLQCVEHGRWSWTQGNRDLRKIDDDQPGRTARLRSPGQLRAQDEDLVVTSPDNQVLFHIAEFPSGNLIEGPFTGEDSAIDRAKVIATGRGVRLWKGISDASGWSLVDKPIF